MGRCELVQGGLRARREQGQALVREAAEPDAADALGYAVELLVGAGGSALTTAMRSTSIPWARTSPRTGSVVSLPNRMARGSGVGW